MSPKRTLLLMTLIWSSLQECGEGCLKCSSEGTCQICNYNQGFVNQSGVCSRKADTRCLTHGVDGKCLLCKEKYKLDSGTSLCIENGVLIENCLHYSSNGTC